MSFLSRKKGEEIVVGDNMTNIIVAIRGNKVRVSVEAPGKIPVHRREVKGAIDEGCDDKEDRRETARWET